MGKATELTYARYAELGGTLAEGAFEASVGAASAFVADEIWPHGPADAAEREAVERAVAACVDCDAAWGGDGWAGPASFSIGSFSASGSQGAASADYAADMAAAARRQLVGTSLLLKVVR